VHVHGTACYAYAHDAYAYAHDAYAHYGAREAATASLLLTAY
jgi:hypothetical protein